METNKKEIDKLKSDVYYLVAEMTDGIDAIDASSFVVTIQRAVNEIRSHEDCDELVNVLSVDTLRVVSAIFSIESLKNEIKELVKPF
jgi:hypothetical protein